jgi:hypothetical protein
MEEVGLVLHPAKTRIVYCQDANRRQQYGATQFTFLGYAFRSRIARARNGGTFMSFQPAISKEALKKISSEVRSWRLHHRIGSTFAQLAKAINPVVGGWMRYYGAFYPSALHPLLTRINSYLVRWIRNKYRRFKPARKARRAYKSAVRAYPTLFPAAPRRSRGVPAELRRRGNTGGQRRVLGHVSGEFAPAATTGGLESTASRSD